VSQREASCACRRQTRDLWTQSRDCAPRRTQIGTLFRNSDVHCQANHDSSANDALQFRGVVLPDRLAPMISFNRAQSGGENAGARIKNASQLRSNRLKRRLQSTPREKKSRVCLFCVEFVYGASIPCHVNPSTTHAQHDSVFALARARKPTPRGALDSVTRRPHKRTSMAR
jgi:hypothetical protein